MPSVKSIADLRKLALRTGGTLEFDDGTQFNTAKLKGRVTEAPPPIPAQPSRQEPDTVMLVRMMAEALRSVTIQAPAVQVSVPPAEVRVDFPEPPTAPTQWKFVVKRDKEGYISEITARAAQNDQ